MYGAKSIIRAFHEKHGNFVCDEGAYWLYFEDGAYRENNAYGALCEPPQDTRERQKKIIYYWKRKINIALGEFDHLKHSLKINAKHASNNGRCNPVSYEAREDLEKLKQIKAKIEGFQKELSKAEKWLEDNPTDRELRQRELKAVAGKHRDEQDKFISELQSIEI